MKKLIITFMVAVLLVPSLLGLPASEKVRAATTTPIKQVSTDDPFETSDNMLRVNGLGDQYNEEQTLKIIDAGKIMDKYIVDNNGTLSLSENAEPKVEQIYLNCQINCNTRW